VTVVAGQQGSNYTVLKVALKEENIITERSHYSRTLHNKKAVLLQR